MTKAIQQSVVFNSAPEELYGFFMDSAMHTAATGAPAKVSTKIGGKWSAFGNRIGGSNLLLVPNRLVVQAWRSHSWKATDPDSILIVQFEKVAKGARVNLTHVGVPIHDYKGVTQGWKNYYWKSWRKYLSAKKG
jgi:activator of HSP90 ATPase